VAIEMGTDFGPAVSINRAAPETAEGTEAQQQVQARIDAARGNTPPPAEQAPAKAPETPMPKPGEPGFREAVMAQEMMRRTGGRG
jgi:hypothetical protein